MSEGEEKLLKLINVQDNNSKTPLKGWIFIVCLLLAPLIWIGKIHIDAKNSLEWPYTNGKIFHSQVDFDSSSDVSCYEADIRYSYAVQNKQYISRKIMIGYFCGSKNKANELVNQFPLNKNVQIYYNQNNPAQAVLIPGNNKQLIWTYYFLLAFFTLLGAIIYMTKRKYG